VLVRLVVQFNLSRVADSLLVREGELHLWLVDYSLFASNYQDYMRYLSGVELERCGRFIQDASRVQYVMSHAALRFLLSRYVGVTFDQLRFDRGEHGKPGLVGRNVAFNLSHSGDCALIGVTATGEIGVDVELVRDKDSLIGLAERFYTGAERDWLRDSGTRAEFVDRFYQVWTCKEACLKARGVGLTECLKGFSVVSVGAKLAATVPFGGALKWSLYSSALVSAGENYRVACCSNELMPCLISRKLDLLVL
jgi:4'-phosphopantetheinyl transferase